MAIERESLFQIEEISWQRVQSPLRRLGVFLGLTHNRRIQIGLILITFWILVALLAPFLAPHSPEEVFQGDKRLKPLDKYWLGTDQFGRDLLSRILYGAKYELLIGIISTTGAVVVGISLGAIAGFYGGGLDQVIMRVMDLLFAFPSFILALIFSGVLGSGVVNLILSLILVSIPIYARLIRGEILQQKRRQYADAAVVTGCSKNRVLVHHLLLNSLNPVITQLPLTISWVILTAAGISYVGFGIQPPAPEWGLMINEGSNYIVSGDWWISFFPGIALFTLLLGFSLLGDGLNESLYARG